jgi:transcriptional regulator with XRE-family HTH domain
MNFTQEEIATRAGVSWSSFKRFEREGLIALDSLLRIALVLECLDDFEKLPAGFLRGPVGQDLDTILATAAPRRRARSRKAQNA